MLQAAAAFLALGGTIYATHVLDRRNEVSSLRRELARARSRLRLAERAGEQVREIWSAETQLLASERMVAMVEGSISKDELLDTDPGDSPPFDPGLYGRQLASFREVAFRFYEDLPSVDAVGCRFEHRFVEGETHSIPEGVSLPGDQHELAVALAVLSSWHSERQRVEELRREEEARVAREAAEARRRQASPTLALPNFNITGGWPNIAQLSTVQASLIGRSMSDIVLDTADLASPPQSATSEQLERHRRLELLARERELAAEVEGISADLDAASRPPGAGVFAWLAALFLTGVVFPTSMIIVGASAMWLQVAAMVGVLIPVAGAGMSVARSVTREDAANARPGG